MSLAAPNNHFLSLSQLLAQVRKAMVREFPLPVWVKADMLKLNHYSASGHAFPELVEKIGGKVVAKIQAIIWADDLMRIGANFQAITGKKLGDGIEILFRTEIRFHEQFGMRLRIMEIDAQYTLGQMALEKKNTIEKLLAENLFYQNKTIELTTVPQRLAVISAASSRGFSDLRNILRVEGAAFRMELKLFNAILQGEKGADTITARLAQIGKRKDEFDAVLIIRGGGDDTGMDCYDSYKMAQAVCNCPLPVITGIGHSTNETVVEMVAHTNKITPTDVGYFILTRFSVQLNKLSDIAGHFSAQTLMVLAEHDAWLDEQSQFVYNTSRHTFQQQKMILIQLASNIQHLSSSTLNRNSNKLYSELQYIDANSKAMLMKMLYQQNLLQQNLHKTSKSIPQKLGSKLDLLESKIAMLDPQKILKRGYSITLHKGKVIKNIKNIKEGETIETILDEGRLESMVQKTKKQKS